MRLWVLSGLKREGSGRDAERANIMIQVRESCEQVQQQLYTAYEGSAYQ